MGNPWDYAKTPRELPEERALLWVTAAIRVSRFRSEADQFESR